MARIWLLASVAGALLGGCAPSHVYQPVDHASGESLAGRPAAAYPVRGGKIEVAAVGTRKVAQRQQLVFRIRVENDSAAPWALDPLRQQLRTDDGIARLPDHVRLKQKDSIAPIPIPPRSTRTIELGYFLDGAAPPLRIQLAWRVSTPGALFADRTSFTRAAVAAYFDHGPPLAADGYFYRPFFNSRPDTAIVGWDSPRRALPPPRARHALLVPATPIVEDSPPGGYQPYPAY